jgi:hypothetical protein
MEASDIHGPIARGFVMVTDTGGRWLRSSAQTVQKMRMMYKDGIVRVQKDEPPEKN